MRPIYSLICVWIFLAATFPEKALPAVAVKPVTEKENNEIITEIKYRGKVVKLGEKAIYVNSGLKAGTAGKYVFSTLQDAVKFAKDGTTQAPTVIYLEPGVYWTDDPKNNNSQNNLIGLVIPQANITLTGLSADPDHTVIAGDRGQMAGAIGNWNTIGVGDGFHAYNITFGNYCNVDLIYSPDPSKNHTKRQKTITQAQVITKAHAGQMDRWLFDNCRFISFLNVFSRTEEPHRAYYNNCFFQCTDDAIGTGDINIFKNCRFKFYSSHPSGSGSGILQAYLGCKFEIALRSPGNNPILYFAKKNSIFAVLDGEFRGNAGKLEWTERMTDQTRHYVYNNTLNGKPVIISPLKPDLSVRLNSESLKAYKVGQEYNIYNLLRGNDDWDPDNQKERLAKYADLAYRLELTAGKTTIDPRKSETATVSYNIFPERVRTRTPLKWSVSDNKLLSFSINQDGTVTVSGHNDTDTNIRGYIKAETPAGITAAFYFDVAGTPLPAPAFTRNPAILALKNGSLSIDYNLDQGRGEDNSYVSWYRATRPDGSDSIKVAVSRFNRPMKTYNLSTGDIGYYLLVKVEPKRSSSNTGAPAEVVSRKITAADVQSQNLYTDFVNMPSERSNIIRDGFWMPDTHRPIDLSSDFPWEADTVNGWTYGLGTDGADGRYGFMATGRGARLLYSQKEAYDDMSLAVALSPHKSSGQGFGSATGQYLDIYIKFDPRTLTGYGLRIQRFPEAGEGTRFTLYRFVNGAGTPISKYMDSSVFLAGCKVELKVTGHMLSAHVTTSSVQHKLQKESGLPHEVNLSCEIETNKFGGFGVQHTGTVKTGNRFMLESFSVKYL